MDKGRKCHPHGVKSELQRLFVKRLEEERKARGFSINGLARATKGRVGYASVNRILAGKQDPSIEIIEALVDALGLPAWAFFTEADQMEQRVIRPPQNVIRLPDPYPRIFSRKPEEPSTRKVKRKR